MNTARKAIMMLAGLSLAACANIETATRQAPFETAPADVDNVSRAATLPVEAAPAEEVSVQPRFDIAAYEVTVPRSLRVSEANLFYPLGDIVWRGDPKGDRHNQVQAIFEQSLARSGDLITEGQPAKVMIEVQRFHSVTEKTRYTTGGTHSITFMLSAVDPATGATLIAPRQIKADLNALGGSAAIEAERKGFTQKFRVTNHLIKVFHQEMTGSLPAMVAADTLERAPATSG